MSLTVFNGSPRGKSGNTTLLLEHVQRGFESAGGGAFELHYLNRRAQREDQARAFAAAEAVVLAFPLYVHAMPGIVKEFLEVLAKRDPADGVGLGFIVQQGFPETHQSAWLTPYLDRLPRRLGCLHSGTVVKGGVEGIRIMPAMLTNRLFRAFHELGAQLATQGRFDEATVAKLAQPVRLSAGRQVFYRLLHAVGLSNFYWDKHLKENGVYDQRFARPYDSGT